MKKSGRKKSEEDGKSDRSASTFSDFIFVMTCHFFENLLKITEMEMFTEEKFYMFWSFCL